MYAYFRNMKYILFTVCFMTMFACNNAEKNLIKNIGQLEANNSLATSDTLINSYIRFAKEYPNHPNAIKYLFKAAEANVKAKRQGEGARIYEQIANTYKDSTTYVSECLIRAGYNYMVMQDPANEKRVFEQFLKQFPNHPQALEISRSLSLVGLSPEQQDSAMISWIKEKNPDLEINLN